MTCLRSLLPIGLPLLLVFFSEATALAAENVWSVEYLNSRKAEWEQLAGPTIHVEGRVTQHGRGQLRLAKCDLAFHVSDSLLRTLRDKRTVELSGRFKSQNNKLIFEVTQLQVIPTDVEQYESRTAKLRNPRPDEWYQLGDWAAGRSRFYNDEELAKKALAAYSHGVKVEWRALAPDDGEARIRLAQKAAEYKLPDDQRTELLHEGYRLLWLAALKTKQPDPATWTELADRLAKDLPGSTQALARYPTELKQRYEREALTVYRESSVEVRQQLHRLLYAAVVLKPIVDAVAADGRNGDVIADQIEKSIPEEQALADKYRDAKRAWRLARVATVTRQEVEQLANDYRSRQQPDVARQALLTWLQARESRSREDGSVGLLQHADDYLALVRDETKAVELLNEAHKLDPTFADVTLRLESLGYKLEGGTWKRGSAAKPAIPATPTETTTTDGIAVGMTATALRNLMGRPESLGRSITSTGLCEIWSYGTPGTSRLIVRLERTGRTGEVKVIEFDNER